MVAGAVLSIAWLRVKEREFESNFMEQDKRGVAMHLAHSSGLQAEVARKLVLWFEVFVIVIGTLISGFGDLA